MKKEEAGFILERIISLWPLWKPDGSERSEWLKNIRKMPYPEADGYVSAFYAETSRYPRPNLPDLLVVGRRVWKENRLAERRKNQSPEPAFYLAKEGVDGYKKAIYCPTTNDPDRIMSIAENTRQQHEAAYGGKWNIIKAENFEDPALSALYKNLGENPQKDIPRQITPQRAKRIREAILVGPDCPGKRFLQGQKTEKAENEGPAKHISEALASVGILR